MLKRILSRVGSVGLVAISLISVAGCNGPVSIIDKVVVTPSANLETIRVALQFKNSVQTSIAGGFTIKNYGELFIDPYTNAEPFTIGFDLNTAIVNDQDFIHLSPTTTFPNGVPMGLPYAVVEIRSPTPIDSKFDIYGYVDVMKFQWLGVAGIFHFVDQFFPAGMSINQVFMRDKQGNPGVLASAFGPQVDNSNNITRSGGISVFANVKQLLSQLDGKNVLTLYAREDMTLAGQGAARYEGNPRALRQLQTQIVQGLNNGAHY